ncbi:MAG TPA: copper-containing nitrite reductase, partial [Ignavibacteriaceae bacterium]|nr:copper-containing nitrite reductase [Ignavibacteriaceae bacterium]
GKFIRIKEGDEVEFNLHNNPSSKMPHNIDLHAVTGPGGGAASSFTAPGHTSTFSFKALNPGLYVYHCATAPVGLHIANGMYGLILVEPKEGLPPVDHEFYIMQSEFYTEGKNGDPGIQSFSQQKAINEEPEYVVFNGSVGSLTGDNSIKAKAGETIRLFVGNGGPNLVSSFHLIGEIFDKVYGEGGTIVTQKNVQTTLIPAGGAAIVEFKVDVPGTYSFVDHSIFRAFNKGAIGMLQVSGEKDSVLYSGKQKDEIYQGSDMEVKASVNPLKLESNSELESPDTKDDLKMMGEGVFKSTCIACHQANGEGLPNVFPPLAGSDYLNQNKERAVNIVVNGLQKQVTVNGKNYNGIMPPQNLTNKQISAVLTYVYSQWGNSGKVVKEEEVGRASSKRVALGK